MHSKVHFVALFFIPLRISPKAPYKRTMHREYYSSLVVVEVEDFFTIRPASSIIYIILGIHQDQG